MSLSYGKISFAVTLWLAITLFTVLPSQGGGTITENFDNNQYNQQLWWIDSMGEGVTSIVANNSLEITLPLSTGGTRYMGMMGGAFTLSGDFDLQVDFDLLTWPLYNEAQIGISINQANDFSIFRRSGSEIEGGEKYFTMIKGSYSQVVPVSVTPGKLRVKRTGNTMEGSYWNGEDWVVIGSGTDPSLGQDVNINLNFNRDEPFAGPVVKAAFDNIYLIYDKIIYEREGNPIAGIFLLLN